MIRIDRVKRILSLAAVFTAAAASPAAAASLALNGVGDLAPDRASAQLTVTVQCDAPANVGETKTGTLTVHVFQPSGRLLNIGLGSASANCDGNAADVLVEVDAIPGLKFKPGPATAIIKLAEETTDSTSAIVGSTTTEGGTKVTLRP
jgi:hypothetical protein